MGGHTVSEEFKIADRALQGNAAIGAICRVGVDIQTGWIAPPADKADVLAGKLDLHVGGEIFGDLGDDSTDALIGVAIEPERIGLGSDGNFIGRDHVLVKG